MNELERAQRKQAMLAMYPDSTLAEIGAHFKISKQRVHQIIGPEIKAIKTSGRVRKIMPAIEPLLGHQSDTEIAAQYPISKSGLHRLRRRLGIGKASDTLHCEKCATNHYARGMCKNCYARWHHRQKQE